MCSSDIFLGVLAILFPPLPVWVKRGICSADSIINILLCVLGFLPGLLHAWYIIAKFPDEYDDYESLQQQDREGNNHTIYIVQGQPQRQSRPHQGGANYGTTSHQPQQQGVANAGGSSNQQSVPPSYAQAVAGDNKIQSHD